ncbi:uncharacterized protein LOC144448946 [Glandiceps talaboti]
MDRKAKFKHGARGDASKLKGRRRVKQSEMRKQRREKVLAAKRMRYDSHVTEEQEDEFTEEQMVELAKEFQKSNPDRLEQLKKLRKMFAQNSALIDTFLGVENAMDRLVGILSGNDEDLQRQAAWCITNMAGSAEHEHTMKTLKMAAPYLITFLSGQNTKLQDQSAWALGNMAGDSDEARDTLMSQGILQPVVKLLQSSTPSVVQSAAFALSNLARGQGADTSAMLEAGVVPHLLSHMEVKEDNMAVLTEVAWVLTYLAAKLEHEDELVSAGTIPKLVQAVVTLSNQKPHHVQSITPLLRCLGNMCSGPDEYIVKTTEDGTLLPALERFLDSEEHRHVKKETLWVISNVTGVESVCQTLIDMGLPQKMIQLLHSTFDIKKEAALCLCNLAHHGEKYCEGLIKQEVFPHVIAMLKSHDPEMVMEALWFSEMLLRMTNAGSEVFKEHEGVDSLEALEYHSDSNIQQAAHELLEMYFYQEPDQTEEKEEGDEKADFPPWRLEAQNQQQKEQSMEQPA